jgi:hypothetical protein
MSPECRWDREYHVSGMASRAKTSATVTQMNEGVPWIDAAQIEEGDEPSGYQWPLVDQQAMREFQGKAVELPPRLNDPPRSAVMLDDVMRVGHARGRPDVRPECPSPDSRARR